MNGAQALVTIHKTEGGMSLEALGSDGGKVSLWLDFDEGMMLADEIHRACWQRPEAWGRAPEATAKS
jgi:hypothetical protein